MIEITKDNKYTLYIRDHELTITAQEINELRDKLTTFINENYKELNPDTN